VRHDCYFFRITKNNAISSSIFGHVDFLGKGATTPLEDVGVRWLPRVLVPLRSHKCYAKKNKKMQTQYALRIQRDFSDLNFFFFSDVWLDQADTLRGLQKIFDNCIENNFIPKVIVFCGNFTSSGIAQGNSRDIQKYQG
jgi:DNA polymerase epsilon subunit 2